MHNLFLFTHVLINEQTQNFPLLICIGKNYEKVCEMCHITLNKIAIFGDNGTITPGGVRIG